MICVECCQKESNIKDGREVLCPICRRDWTEWIYEHYPIAVVGIPCAKCGLRNGHTYDCYNDRYGFDDSSDEERKEADGEEEEVDEVDEEEAVDEVQDISAMLRSLGRSYRSR